MLPLFPFFHPRGGGGGGNKSVTFRRSIYNPRTYAVVIVCPMRNNVSTQDEKTSNAAASQ